MRLFRVTFYLLYSICFTYGTLCHFIGHQKIPPPFPSPCLEKRRIYLGLESIVSMGLCSHSQFTFHQKVLFGSFYLRVRDCHRTLFQPLSAFGRTTLLIVLYVFSSICCYRLDHSSFSQSVFYNYIYLIISNISTENQPWDQGIDLNKNYSYHHKTTGKELELLKLTFSFKSFNTSFLCEY